MRALCAPRGDPAWDAVVRGSGLIALLAIPLVAAGPERMAGLAAFFLVTVWINGPLAMFLPAAYEPVLLSMGVLYPALVVAAVGVTGTVAVEAVNFVLFQRLLSTPSLTPARESRAVRGAVRLFQRAPFLAVWLCSWSPLPYWPVRITAPLARYPLGPYLLATLLGRFPRYWFFATLGAMLQLPLGALLVVTVTMLAVGAGVALRTTLARSDPVTPAAEAPG